MRGSLWTILPAGIFFELELFELALLSSWHVTMPLESSPFCLLVVGSGTRMGSFFEPNFADVGS